MSRIYWDSMLFIYWSEGHPVNGARVEQIASKMRERGDELCTSVFTLGEVLIGPLKSGRLDIEKKIRALFRSPFVNVLPITDETMDRYALIRSEKRIKPPDAIHLAAAAEAEVELFLTNDAHLQRFTVKGIDFIAGLNVNLF